jgi:hypothetical protein
MQSTFVPRLLNAVGYAGEPTCFVSSGSIEGAHDLKHAKNFISNDGSFQSDASNFITPRAMQTASLGRRSTILSWLLTS